MDRNVLRNIFLLFITGTFFLCPLMGRLSARMLAVDDFNSAKNRNLLGGLQGAWEIDPFDSSQFCEVSFSSKVRMGNEGYSLRLRYDVDSDHDVANGYWMKLNDADLSTYKYFILFIKGDSSARFTSKIFVELKNENQASKITLKGITKEWQKMVLPLSMFSNITEWTEMTEFVIVFEDKSVSYKTGTLYLDNLLFTDSLKSERDAVLALKSVGVDFRKDEDEIVITSRILFRFDKYLIPKSQVPILTEVSRFVNRYPDLPLEIHGHTDSIGSTEYNQKLSEKRAKSVGKFLVRSEEVSRDRITTRGFGETDPVASNKKSAGRSKNRRVEFKLITAEESAGEPEK